MSALGLGGLLFGRGLANSQPSYWGLGNMFTAHPIYCPQCPHCLQAQVEFMKAYRAKEDAIKEKRRSEVLRRIASRKIEVLAQMEVNRD